MTCNPSVAPSRALPGWASLGRYVEGLLSAAGVLLAAGCTCPRSETLKPSRCVADPGVVQYLMSLDEPARVQSRILVARAPIAAGTPLRASLFTVHTTAPGFKWSGQLRPVDLVHFAGRPLRRSLARGEPIRRRDLEGEPLSNRAGSGEALSAGLLPAGTRVVPLQVDWVGGPGTWLRSGDRVDIGLVRVRGGAGPALTMLMQDARVVMAAPWGQTRPRRLWLSVLALPREAHGLVLAQQLGKIVVFPRPSGDNRNVRFRPVTLRELQSAAFWDRLRRQRQRLLGRPGADDPGLHVK